MQLSYAPIPLTGNTQSGNTIGGGQPPTWTSIFSQLLNGVQPATVPQTTVPQTTAQTGLSPTLSPAYATSFLNVLNTLLAHPDLEDIKIVCTDEEIAQLKVVKFQDFKNSDACKTTECNICLEEYVDDDDLMLLNCKHYFHEKCVKHWLEEDSNKCPLCREEVAKGKPLI